MSGSHQYSRVPLEVQDGTSGSDADTARALFLASQARKERIRQIGRILHSLMWVTAGALVSYYSKLYQVVTEDDRVNRPALYVGSGFAAVFVGIFLHLSVWVTGIMGQETDDFNSTHPRHIQTACVVGLLSWWSCSPLYLSLIETHAVPCACTYYYSFVVALWPVYGWVTLIIMCVMTMALLLGSSLIPSCSCGARRKRKSNSRSS